MGQTKTREKHTKTFGRTDKRNNSKPRWDNIKMYVKTRVRRRWLGSRSSVYSLTKEFYNPVVLHQVSIQGN